MWQIILGISIAFVLLEIFMPNMFFLNFAFAGLICAGISYFYHNVIVLIILFSIFSLIFIFILRPVLVKNINIKDTKTGLEEKYVGKTAQVVQNIDKNQGVISIYDERWEARNIDDGVIEAGAQVEIVSHESLIIKVKKIN